MMFSIYEEVRALKTTIDARGKACPEPVVMTKRTIESLEEETLTVVVDNRASCENVERFARSQGCHVKVGQKDEGYVLEIVKGYPCEIKPEEGLEAAKPRVAEQHVVVYIGADHMGAGSEELGRMLIRAFLKTLRKVTPRPKKLIFVNSGVKLLTEGSEAIESIKELEDLDIEILSCGTCLDYFHLKDKLRVGLVSNMFDIVSSLMEAEKVIRP
jgi:selenium metabolism protein YedF